MNEQYFVALKDDNLLAMKINCPKCISQLYSSYLEISILCFGGIFIIATMPLQENTIYMQTMQLHYFSYPMDVVRLLLAIIICTHALPVIHAASLPVTVRYISCLFVQ